MIDYFKAAVAKLRERGRPEPNEYRGPTETDIKQLLDTYAAEIRGEMKSPAPRQGMWIFHQAIDHEAYIQALVLIMEEAHRSGRFEGAAALADDLEYQCACRCQAHQRRGCPRCLNIYGCPVHGEADASQLRLDLLQDPLRLTPILWSKLTEAVEADLSWEELTPEIQLQVTEVVRQLVTVRLEALRK